jgi:hypothetical protein
VVRRGFLRRKQGRLGRREELGREGKAIGNIAVQILLTDMQHGQRILFFVVFFFFFVIVIIVKVHTVDGSGKRLFVAAEDVCTVVPSSSGPVEMFSGVVPGNSVVLHYRPLGQVVLLWQSGLQLRVGVVSGRRFHDDRHVQTVEIRELDVVVPGPRGREGWTCAALLTSPLW